MKLLSDSVSHIGLVRKKNDDSFLCMPEQGLFAVADGLGGLPFGDVASQTAINYLKEKALSGTSNAWENKDCLELIRQANTEVIIAGNEAAQTLGIGTTFSFLAQSDGLFHGGHIGDSRIYYWDTENFIQATTDHTLATFAREEQQLTEDIPIPQYYYHTLTQCLGQRQLIKPQSIEIPIRPGYRYFICSDGVSGVLSDAYLQYQLLHHDHPGKFLDQIIADILEEGAPDNATAVAIFAE